MFESVFRTKVFFFYKKGKKIRFIVKNCFYKKLIYIHLFFIKKQNKKKYTLSFKIFNILSLRFSTFKI